MSRFVVVGSGPSGVHAALTLLERGHDVLLLDVGHRRPAPVLPAATFHTLKRELDDPAAWFLGARFEGVTFPSAEQEYYGLPPSKGYVLEPVPQAVVRGRGFAPLFSFAQGGLAEAWTAGVYPFNDAELADFPFGYGALAPHYATVARRIGVTGADDDLARFMPLHAHLEPPLRLDAHSALLLERYAARRTVLNRAGCFAGRSRLAVLTQPRAGRGACTYSGRCLWGCPHDALYTPSVTLRDCSAHHRFTYRSGAWVSHVQLGKGRRATGVVVVGGTAPETVAADAVVLAAGALSSARIVLETLRRHEGSAPELPGLMDNQQVLIPFLNLGMIGRGGDRDAYQYHQVCLGFAAPDPRQYVHAQLTTLKAAMVHPILQSLPLDLRSAARVFRTLRAGLGVANVNLHDTRRPDCTVALASHAGDGPAPLELRYTAAPGDAARIAGATRRVRRALRALGCVVPPGMTHVRPKGASVHYAGLIPMAGLGPLTATPEGACRDLPGLWLADGVTFPFLPAKNITFTLMANAVRVAAAAAS